MLITINAVFTKAFFSKQREPNNAMADATIEMTNPTLVSRPKNSIGKAVYWAYLSGETYGGIL